MSDRELDSGGSTPFTAYRVLSTAFNSSLIGVVGAGLALRRLRLPPSPLDLLTMAAATHKLSLILTQERVTLPLRSPFTTQSDAGREGGHASVPRGEGMQRALGELLTCPHCAAPWIALGLVAGYVLAPVPTRVVTTVFSTVALADTLSHAYGWIREEHRKAQSAQREP